MCNKTHQKIVIHFMIAIKCFCLNDQIQNSFSLLCIEFQIILKFFYILVWDANECSKSSFCSGCLHVKEFHPRLFKGYLKVLLNFGA